MKRLAHLGFINAERTRAPVRKRLRSRGVPTALQAYEVLCTQDLTEANEAISALIGPSSLNVDAAVQAEFQATLNAIRFLDVSMAFLDCRAPATLVVHSTADAFAVHMPTHIDAGIVIGGRHHQASTYYPLVTNPGDCFVQHLGADCPQIIVRIERAAMERQLSRMLGRYLDRPIVFEPVADLTTDEAARWHGALQVLSSEIVSPASLIRRGIGLTPIEELIISTLLYIQPSTYFKQLREPHPHRERTVVHRSIDYIERHLAEPITLADLAGHAGTSVRSIQLGFREDLDTTPVTYIRNRRLDKARGVLLDAAAGDGVTVGAVALRWGFSNPGTFAVHYRERFGESPSDTLRH
ncbi:MAG: AraC family transcriptional regulator [Actinomycetota bacterium]|nr:AraC family transcriptional regulator [Actinomycetota bacterium]